MLSNARNFAIVLILGIGYLCLYKYFQTAEEFSKNSKSLDFNDSKLVSPGSGTHLLPKEVQAVLKARDSLSFSNYNIYGNMRASNMEVFQRINEALWPTRMDYNSKYQIGLTPEMINVPGITILYNHDNICIGIK